MIELTYVVGLSMTLTNLVKHKINTKRLVPLLATFLIVVFNCINAYLFNADILTASKDAFIAGGLAVGLFASTDNLIKRS